MRKTKSYLMALLLVTFISFAAKAQTTISGKVENTASKESVAAVSVTVKGSGEGTFTDDKGNFKLSVSKLPATLLISSIGYEMQEITVSDAGQPVKVGFKPSNTLGQEVVVSATRTSQKILESPVSIERISTAAIRNAPAPSYYDVIGTLKGVDMVTSSLTFKTPTTRGFAGSGNTRVNQIVDGMDNQAPGLNFSVGSVIGLTELDVENVELLPGASSALYGPGGMNGTIIIASKNPFKYQGLSMQVKEGVMNVGGRFRDPSNYMNASLRFAHKVSDKFAFKIGAEYIRAKDWLGHDERNYGRVGTTGFVKDGTRNTDPNYDGVNMYGDETTADINPLIKGVFASEAPFLVPFVDTLLKSEPVINVSRTGYKESEVVNPNTINIKLSGALHYKVSQATELILAGYWGTGNTVYTGSDRYNLRNLKMGQYKLELNNKKWYVRAYTTQEDAGESYNATVNTRLMNEGWKKSITYAADGVTPDPQASDWFVQYGVAYVQGRLNGLQSLAAHNFARGVADIGRPDPGSARFNTILDSVRAIPIPRGGLFVDKTNLYQIEGQYNLTEYTEKFAEVIIGGNFKKYVLNSQGTLFADSAGTIGINEYGAYVQASKKLIEDRLKLTVSGRYDKNQNFAGRFTPRITALIKVAENNNIRFSYQTAYRFPSTQQQWINLNVGSAKLLGGNKFFEQRYALNPATTFFIGQDINAIKPYASATFKPESVSTFEFGYKGLLAQGKLLIDAYGYWGQYQDFITRRNVIQPTSGDINQLKADLAAGKTASDLGDIYSIPVNIASKVKNFGWGFGLDYRLPLNFTVGANVSSDELKDVPSDFAAYFSTPKYRANMSLGNTGFGYKKRMGFNVTYRWQDAFEYESDFINGAVNAIHTLDAQVNCKFPAQKILVKLGATNLLNEYYTNGIGNSVVGGLYYISIGYNVF